MSRDSSAPSAMACREQRKAQSEPQARASFRASSWRPPVSDRPTLTLYARVGKGEVAPCRWPTTIGGWRTIEKSDGSMALKYKESVTGDAIWPEVLATPTWHPAPDIPTRKLLIKRGDTWKPKTEIIGPVYRAAYGLVALVHHQIEGVNERGEPKRSTVTPARLVKARSGRRVLEAPEDAPPMTPEVVKVLLSEFP